MGTNTSSEIAVLQDEALTISVGNYQCRISVGEIVRAWTALSHFPEKRARLELAELARTLNNFAAEAMAIAARGGAVDPVAESERFARQHVELARKAWAAESRCASWFVVGRSNFPSARNAKRMASRDKAYAAYHQHAKTAHAALLRAVNSSDGPIQANHPDAARLLRAKIVRALEQHEKMKAANAIIRAATNDDVEALAAAVSKDTGWQRGTCLKIVRPNEFGSRGIPDWMLTNARAQIRRLEARLAQIERNHANDRTERTHETSVGAVRYVEDPKLARVQLIFADKPDEAVRAKLKQSGFRWSPSQGAWQRHLTTAGRYAAARMLEQLANARIRAHPNRALPKK